LLATGGVDKHVTLSTIDLSDEFQRDLHQYSIDLPYAKLPAKTTSSLQDMVKGESLFMIP